jgi:protein-tyrosine phosphatase
MFNKLNFRDCGGHATAHGRHLKYGMLYRSGSLDRLRGKDFSIIAALGLQTIIDLRPSNERHGRITFLPGCNRVTIPFDIESITRKRIMPFMRKRDGTKDVISAVKSVYSEAATPGVNPIRMIFNYLTEKRHYPVCINCFAGKDRTGFTIALLLRLLGVPFNEIMNDYLATNGNILPRVRRFTTPLKLLSFGLLPTDTWEAALTAYDTYLATAFNRIEGEYHGIKQYLSLCGVSPKQQKQFASIMLE